MTTPQPPWRRANLGCGGQLADEWANVDRAYPEGYGHVDNFILCDMATEPLPFPDHSLQYAVCHHVLDLFDAGHALEFLRECKRVTRPHGTLRVSVADTMASIDAAERIDDEWFAPIGKHWAAVQDKLDYYLRLDGARKMFLTTTLTAHLLQGAGFRPFVVAYKHTTGDHEHIVDLDTRPGESIWLEGRA